MSPGATERVLVLEPGRADRNYWSDLWAYRELFIVLAWRDVSVRYKQDTLSVAWAVIRSLLAMIVFTIIFGRVAQLPSTPGVPYPVMVFAGILPWFLISTILSEASQSVVLNASMISKIYDERGDQEADNPKTPVAAPSRCRLSLNRNRTRASVTKQTKLSEKL